jgi:hypothetical protein
MLDREKDGIYTTTLRGTTIGALTRAQVADAVECYECGAKRGAICTGTDKPHASRRAEAMRLYGLTPPQAVLHGKYIDDWYRGFRAYAKDIDGYNQRKRLRTRRREERRAAIVLPSSVAVTYECPICGGPHARADHPPARPGVIRIRRQV